MVALTKFQISLESSKCSVQESKIKDLRVFLCRLQDTWYYYLWRGTPWDDSAAIRNSTTIWHADDLKFSSDFLSPPESTDMETPLMADADTAARSWQTMPDQISPILISCMRGPTNKFDLDLALDKYLWFRFRYPSAPYCAPSTGKIYSQSLYRTVGLDRMYGPLTTNTTEPPAVPWPSISV